MQKPIVFSLSKPFLARDDQEFPIRPKTLKPWEDFDVWYQ